MKFNVSYILKNDDLGNGFAEVTVTCTSGEKPFQGSNEITFSLYEYDSSIKNIIVSYLQNILKNPLNKIEFQCESDEKGNVTITEPEITSKPKKKLKKKSKEYIK